jgi:hypothetical protein
MLKNEVNYKALAFLAEQTASTFNYDVKGARALWDPGLSIPGTNRRGGWRCPVGTRYGGQITDRYGRSCGWGVARRIANQIADIGERLENVDDRKRNARLAKRNARVQRFLARQDKPGLLERGARGIADALDGGGDGKPITAPRAPARPRVPAQQQRPRIPVQPPARPQNGMRRPNNVQLGGMLDENGQVMPVGGSRRRGNLRESEARRMDREIVQPGAPRTGEPPAPNAPRRRRRNAAQQGAKRTVRRKPEADFVDGSKPAPTKVPRRKPAPKPQEPPKPSTPIPPPPAWNPTADELGGSVPDDRSIRNVVNRFGDLRGLPEDAYWRKPDFPEGEEKAELERRFGRYYDDNNKRNARGNFVNQQIFGQQAGAPQPEPKAPARPAGPPPIPARDINPKAEFDQQRDEALVKAVEGEIERYKPNAYNNLRNLPKEEVLGKKIRDQELLKEAQAGFDRAFDDWRSKKNGNERERDEARDNLLRMWGQKEKIKDGISAAELRIVEIDAGIEFRQRPAANNVNAPNAVNPPAPPAPQARVQPPQRPVDAPMDPSKIDVSPPKVKKDYRNEIGKPGADGLPGIEPTPVGNKGINSKEEAVEFLKNGGSIAEIPDDFLIEAIQKNSIGANPRFEEKRPDRQGVNDTIKYKDTLNGKTYYMKYHSRIGTNNEDVHEIVGNNIAGRMGMPVGQYRLDGVMQDGKHRAVLLEDVRNYMEGDVMEPEDRGRNIEPADKIRATLLDFVIVNIDRHHGNFFQVVQNGKKRFAPIDPSLGFDAKWGGAREFRDIEPTESGLRAFLNNRIGGGRNSILDGLRADKNSGRVHRDEVVAAIASVQKSIRDAEAKNAYRTFAEKAKNVATVTGQEEVRSKVTKHVIQKPDARMKFIADIDPSRLADILLGL